MNNNKHTPGPWTVEPCRNKVFPHSIQDSDKGEIAVVVESLDARLIAAAPDLLEALKLARDTFDLYANAISGKDKGRLKVSKILDAAIAKAEGK